jgi:DNA-binding CsgD family transcriptional regulator
MSASRETSSCNLGSLCEKLLDVLDVALIVLDGRGQLVFSNQKARRTLVEGAGLRIEHGRLQGSPEDSAALVRAARECVSSSASLPARCLRVPRPEHPPLMLSLTSVRIEHEGSTEPLAVGVIHDPAARLSLEPAEIAARYGLTPAEARVAAEVSDGKVAKVIARDLHIGLATVRSHLRSIYVKLGVGNANELIALLRGSVFHRTIDGAPSRSTTAAAAPVRSPP